MVCNFCHSPAAHPSNGCQYGPNTLACRDCTVAFWTWVRAHTKPRPNRKGPPTERSFYESIR